MKTINIFSCKLPSKDLVVCSAHVILVAAWLVQIKHCQCQVDGVSQSTFKIVRGKRLASGVTWMRNISRQGLTLQRCAIACAVDCGMFEFNKVYNACIFYKERNYDIGITVSSDTDWTWAYKRRHTTISHGGWTLVFRAQAKIQVSAYETWNDTAATTDNPVQDSFPHACLRLVDYASCDRHFRSHIVDNWDNVDKVRFSLINNELEVAYILFDGVGSNRSSWFSQSRVLSSSWFNMRADSKVDIFDLFGFKIVPKLWRTFLIFGPKVICNLDKFYTMVIDQSSDSCLVFWDIDLTGYPSFYYSTEPDMGNLYTLFSADQHAQAEVLAVSVTFL
ncbi:hypothetical protein RRG08_018620 [Elysia crispata]|uniref:Uncharacterized protein n=1 Tax=Elysia crispata TaxID=231223 RepID=A0AAE1DER3_9GAST|nr:hypothetical protein RRG08_018620 [Elysia crispata]